MRALKQVSGEVREAKRFRVLQLRGAMSLKCLLSGAVVLERWYCCIRAETDPCFTRFEIISCEG
jgi:hypothetical protein